MIYVWCLIATCTAQILIRLINMRTLNCLRNIEIGCLNAYKIHTCMKTSQSRVPYQKQREN